MRPDFWTLANQCHVKMGNPPATRGDSIESVFEEFIRFGALPLRIARRKMRTDIAVGERAQDGIDQRVEADISIGVGEKAASVWHANAADHHVIAFAKGVNVVADAGSDIAKRCAETGFFAD